MTLQHRGCHCFMIIIILSMSSCLRNNSCSKILAIFSTPAKSHQVIFDTILVELSERGHDLTVVTQFPETLENYERIKVISIKGTFKYNTTIEQIYEMSANSYRRTNLNFIDQYNLVNDIFYHENMKPIWNMETKYDLVLTEMFMTDAFLVIPYLYKTPYISLASAVLHPQHSQRLGLPDNPSYIPTFVSAATDIMSFVERFENALVSLYTKWYYEYVSHSISNEIIRKKFPNKRIPKIQDLLNNCSLVLTNTHYTINSARPLPPNVVEIGGVHLKTPKKLNGDFEKFLNDSKDGVIYFSMGSILKTSSFPPEKFKAFLDAFAKIPQRILWKIEDESLLRGYKNIRAAAWMPQRDIFAHPNVKLFISHGGLLGIIEAVNEGIPVLGIPVFADQWSNVKKLESLRAGKLLRYPDINENSITEALKIVLSPE
uniref:Ecdysteroid UDP-glucosyltransferase n=1 Tax=Cacopsylla melanoneura TaxID=428564 RepID=A0A8D8VIS9_9HEMI